MDVGAANKTIRQERNQATRTMLQENHENRNETTSILISLVSAPDLWSIVGVGFEGSVGGARDTVLAYSTAVSSSMLDVGFVSFERKEP